MTPRPANTRHSNGYTTRSSRNGPRRPCDRTTSSRTSCARPSASATSTTSRRRRRRSSSRRGVCSSCSRTGGRIGYALHHGGGLPRGHEDRLTVTTVQVDGPDAGTQQPADILHRPCQGNRGGTEAILVTAHGIEIIWHDPLLIIARGIRSRAGLYGHNGRHTRQKTRHG
jgi:hypothetical protein